MDHILCSLNTQGPSVLPNAKGPPRGLGNLTSTMLSKKPWTVLTTFQARDPTAIELPEVLSNLSSLYSWRQFSSGADKLKSPKMQRNVTVQGVCWLCFSNAAPLDFRLNCPTYLKESSTQTQKNTWLLAICLPSHVFISDKIWDNRGSLVLSHNINSTFPADQHLLH